MLWTSPEATKQFIMDSGEIDDKQSARSGPLPGLLRPPVVFVCAILLGMAHTKTTGGLSKPGNGPLLADCLSSISPESIMNCLVASGEVQSIFCKLKST